MPKRTPAADVYLRGQETLGENLERTRTSILSASLSRKGTVTATGGPVSPGLWNQGLIFSGALAGGSDRTVTTQADSQFWKIFSKVFLAYTERVSAQQGVSFFSQNRPAFPAFEGLNERNRTTKSDNQ
jgi:hypothetical protein